MKQNYETFKLDSRFKNYYEVDEESGKGRLRQVFFYTTSECNISCVQCLDKLDISYKMSARKEIPLEEALKLLYTFRKMGAIKLSLLGGEPTLYSHLKEIIRAAKEMGYQYVRIDTNGIFPSKLLEDPDFQLLDEITFSIDGPNAEINNKIRGKNTFGLSVSNLEKAIELGYNVNITTCISKYLVERDENGNLYLDRMIKFAEEKGVKRINFHNLFKTGVPRDHFSGDIDITVQEWFKIWYEINDKIDSNEYSIPVRIPMSFVPKEEFDKNPQYYGFCPVKDRTRILVHPNGILRVCSLMIGTPYGIARYYDNKIVWDESLTNEIQDHKMELCTVCTNQSKNNKFGDEFVPLCVSFKPGQQELIWTEEVKWEERRNSSEDNSEENQD